MYEFFFFPDILMTCSFFFKKKWDLLPRFCLGMSNLALLK